MREVFSNASVCACILKLHLITLGLRMVKFIKNSFTEMMSINFALS